MFVGNFGGTKLADLRKYGDKKELRKSGISQIGADQLWEFSRDMEKGDIVIAYSDKHVLGVGKITGDYDYRPILDPVDNRYYDWNTRTVEWVEISPPIDVSSDTRLFGTPPAKYGALNKQLTILPIGEADFNYVLNKYAQVEEALKRLPRY